MLTIDFLYGSTGHRPLPLRYIPYSFAFMEAFQLLSRGGSFSKSRFKSDVNLFVVRETIDCIVVELINYTRQNRSKKWLIHPPQNYRHH